MMNPTINHAFFRFENMIKKLLIFTACFAAAFSLAGCAVLWEAFWADDDMGYTDPFTGIQYESPLEAPHWPYQDYKDKPKRR